MTGRGARACGAVSAARGGNRREEVQRGFIRARQSARQKFEEGEVEEGEGEGGHPPAKYILKLPTSRRIVGEPVVRHVYAARTEYGYSDGARRDDACEPLRREACFFYCVDELDGRR